LVAYIRFQASELPRVVGVDVPGGRRRSDGRAGHLCHGPYLTLTPGRYAAGFYVRREPGDYEGEIEIEASCDHGRRRLGGRSVPVRDLFSSVAGLQHVDFVIDAVERGCELRFWAPARCLIELSEVVLFRNDLSERRRI
jgi:hypothetical protein